MLAIRKIKRGRHFEVGKVYLVTYTPWMRMPRVMSDTGIAYPFIAYFWELLDKEV